MTPRLYFCGDIQIGRTVTLSTIASHHLARVLRAKPEATVHLFNGDGNNYIASLLDIDNKRCTANILSCSPCTNESPLQITLLQGLSRHDRMDACLQKSTELGVHTIVPVICSNSKFKLDDSRVDKKMSHWQQVIVSACEQSGRCAIPQLQKPTSLAEAIAQLDDFHKLVFNPDTNNTLSQSSSTNNNIAVLIGPESGLTDDELSLVNTHGFITVSFGPRILRTETAGPAAITALQTLWGDLG